MKKNKKYKLVVLTSEFGIGNSLSENLFKSKKKALKYYLKEKNNYSDVINLNSKTCYKSFETKNYMTGSGYKDTVFCSLSTVHSY